MFANLEPLARRALQCLPAETAHDAAIWALGKGLVPRVAVPEKPVSLWGYRFRHPVGLAAGFDKNGAALPGLVKCGFSFIEVGTVTPRPQPGNPKPRLFRIPEHQAIINRLGFNNQGHAALQQRLDALSPALRASVILGVNIGKNKDSADAAADYVAGVKAFGGRADYITVNISSPNTPGLRDLQNLAALEPLLDAVMNTMQQQQTPKPLCLKIAPDLAADDIAAIAQLAEKTGFSGLIVSNTTIQRPADLPDWAKAEAGGLSGQPLKPFAEAALAAAREAAPQLPLIAVGGIGTAADVAARLHAGATLVQVYSAFVYQGATLVPALNSAAL
ncbi:MAG: quinone-dependent dihydroorotate dehydrogenase [Holosporales bacterium]